MATLGCSAAERLLSAYLEAIRESNKANLDYAQVLQTGAPTQVRAKGKIASDSTERLRVAREAYQLHRRKHHC